MRANNNGSYNESNYECTTMSVYGHVGEFDPDTDDWAQYTERLGHFFVANDIDEANKKQAILLSVCGAKTYNLMRSLTTPGKPGDKTFDELVTLITNHHNPTPSAIVQRFKFNSRFREQGESVADFIANLRRLSEHCNYADTLNDMLRDRLVCGINDDNIQRKLLSETDLTFKKAYDMAIAQETAVRNAKDLKSTSTEVHKLSQGRPNHRKHGSNKNPEPKNAAGPSSETPTCYRCGGKHWSRDCRFKDSECNFCHKKGHLINVCRSRLSQNNGQNKKTKKKSRSPVSSTNTNLVESMDQLFDENEYSVYHMNAGNSDPIMVTMNVQDRDIVMEVDTGASTTLISEHTFKNTWNVPPPLEQTMTNLRTYTGESIKVVGRAEVSVKHGDKIDKLPLLVVKGDGPSLLGRNWLNSIKLNWQEIKQVRNSSSQLEQVLSKYADVFRDELGTLHGFQAKFHVDEKQQPRFFKPRPLPYMMRERVEVELEKLQSQGIIEPVQFSKWAAPIVPVIKSDGKSLRLCGDYKVTVNSASKLDQYPIPRIEDLYSKLSGGKTFTKLDMNQAYLQLLLDEESKEYTVINTHRGLFRYNRLPFGISSSPAIFQRAIDSLLQSIPNVVVYLDDILVTGETDAKHLENLTEVLRRMSEAGLRLKRSKCTFQAPEVVYLGHKVDAQGLHPTEEKVRAVRDAPAPSNITELRSFLGIVNYYGKFLPNLSSTLAPLHKLLTKNTKWSWTKSCQKAFVNVKKMLKSSKVLVHYDPSKELLLACDASPYGVGAVLSHVMPDGSEQPICFASRSLGSAEKNYSQLDKEGLAVVFGVKKFHQYLYGRNFRIVTDHKPLVSLFSANKTIPLMASARMVRWGLTLGAYNYTIEYRAGISNANADALSRLPLPESPSSTPIPGDTVLLMSTLPVNADKIKEWTDKDPLLSRVRKLILTGWPAWSKDVELRPYYSRKLELSCEDGCVLWGTRVIIPPQGRNQVLNQLHSAHAGISRMKSLGRSFVWWPNFDADLESFVQNCSECQTVRNKPAEAPLHPWEWPDKPWSRLHIDYAGPMMGKMFLIVVDAHSKWLEVCPCASATSAVTIEMLRHIFSTHGLPDIVVSDNGTCFTSSEFQKFMHANGIVHVKTAPYHAASNGMAERAVQVFKNGIRTITGKTLSCKLARFLFRYRTTPQTTTGVSPAELLMGRKLRSDLDMLFPGVKSNVAAKQEQQKLYHDAHAKQRNFSPGDSVYVCNFGVGERWIPGVIAQKTGPVSYKITLQDGRVIRRHQDHVRIRYNSENTSNDVVVDTPTGTLDPVTPEPPQPLTPAPDVYRSPEPRSPPATPQAPPTSSGSSPSSPPRPSPQTPVLRRSSRPSKPPDRLVVG